MANSERIYLIQGNDTDMSVCLRKGGDTPLPYDLTGASRIGLALTGHGLSFFARDIVVSGEDNNIISGLLAGDLLVGEYGLEISFTLDGKAKRFRVPQVFEVVTYLSEDQDDTAEGEGDGISITVTVQPEVIEIAGPTGPQGHDGKSAYEVWLDEGHTGDEDDFFRWLAAQTPNPDWAQYDAAEPDYIENRTHYDIPAVSLPDVFITFRWTEEDYSDLMFYLNDETPMPRLSENVWGVQLGQWLLSCYLNGKVLEVDLDGDPILTVANFRPGSTPQPILVGDIEVPELVQQLDGKYLALKTVNGQSVKGSGDIALNGGNINYTGNDRAYISSGDPIDDNLLLLDQAAEDAHDRLDNLKGSEVVYDGEDGDCVILHGETVDQCLKELDDRAAYITENYQSKINDLDTIRAGAAAGATAYQKPSGGIPASDIASGVIPTNVVKYTEQELTDSQKTQARANIAAASESEVSQLRSDMIEEDKAFTPTWDKVGKYLSLSGGVSTSAAWSISAPFILQKGWTLKVRTEGSGATIIAATTDGTTYTPLVVAPSGDGSLKWFKYTAEADISVAISAKVGQNNVEIYTNGLGLVTALDSDMYGDTIILTGNARSYLYPDEPIPAGDIIQSASGITATGFYLSPASGTRKWVYLFELPYTCEFDVVRIEVNNPNLDTYNITVKHPGVREMIEDKSRIIGEYLFPGYPLAVSAEKLSKSLSDILGLNTSPMAVYATANNYALKPNSLSAQDSNSKIDKYSVIPGDVLWLKLTKDKDAVYQFQNASSIPTSYENTALVGPTITKACEGLVVVPEGATYLMVSSLKTNTTNSVSKVITGNIPGYVEAEKERVYNLLVSRSSGDVHIAAFNTDQHFDLDRIGGNGTYDPRWVMQGVKAMLEIANKLPIDQVVFGGDVAGYNGVTSADVDGIYKTINHLLEPASATDTVVVGIPGNHDAYQNNANVTAAGMHNAYAKKNERHTYFHGNGADNCDAYWDDTTHKIRTIFIDTYSTNVRTEDFRVFLESALSTLPTGYNALIFSHNALTNEFAGTVLAQKISDPTVEIDAFQNPSDCHTILNQYADKIIACICGHTHFDAYGISSSGILYIETTSAAPHSHNYTTENIPNTPTVGTVTDTAFDFFVIDQEALTIEALRYGLGCNRKWVYKGANIGQVSGYPQEIVRQ